MSINSKTDTFNSVLKIPLGILDRILDQGIRSSPKECCGFLSGVESEVTTLVVIPNEADQNDRYLMGIGLIQPFRELRRKNESILAFFHTHPTDDTNPSRTDIQQNSYPNIPHLIVSLQNKEEPAKAFLLQEKAIPVRIEWKSNCSYTMVQYDSCYFQNQSID